MKLASVGIILSQVLGAVILALEENDSEGFKFLSLGDWGDDKTFVGSGLSRFFEQEADGAPLALLLGDNFYEAGVKSVDDAQWNKKYLDVFTGKNLENIRFMVTAGNHDYYGNVSAQIEYTRKDPTKRWLFPSYYHSRFFQHNGVKLYVISIDTWRLNGGDSVVGIDPRTGHTWLRSKEKLLEAVRTGQLSATLADRLAAALPYEPSREGVVDEEQYEWIQRSLMLPAAVDSDWRIVIGHFPIHSASIFEHGDTKSLVNRLNKILEAGNVDAYFAGHDHILQVISKNGKLHYYGSGAGARKHPRINLLYGGLKGYTLNSFGFMKHKATKSTLKTTFVVSQGEGMGDTKTFSFTYKQERKQPPATTSALLRGIANDFLQIM